MALVLPATVEVIMEVATCKGKGILLQTYVTSSDLSKIGWRRIEGSRPLPATTAEVPIAWPSVNPYSSASNPTT